MGALSVWVVAALLACGFASGGRVFHFRPGMSFDYIFRMGTTTSGGFSPAGLAQSHHATVRSISSPPYPSPLRRAERQVRNCASPPSHTLTHTRARQVSAKGTVTVVSSPDYGGDEVLCRFEVTEAHLTTRGHDSHGQSASDFEAALVGSPPIYFVQHVTGEVTALIHEDGSPAWVINLKRSLVASLQVNVGGAGGHARLPAATVTETDVTGTCACQYAYEHHPSTGHVSRVRKSKTDRDCARTAHRGEENTGRSTTSAFTADVHLHGTHGVVKRATMYDANVSPAPCPRPRPTAMHNTCPPSSAPRAVPSLTHVALLHALTRARDPPTRIETVGDKALGAAGTGTVRLIKINKSPLRGPTPTETAAAAHLGPSSNEPQSHSPARRRGHVRRRLSGSFAMGARMTTLLWEDGDVVGSGGVLPADATTAAPRLHTKRARRRHWRRRLKLGGRHDANTQDSASDSASDSSAGTSLPPEVVALVAKLDHDPFNSQLLADLQSQIKRAGISMDDLARGSASSTAAAAARSLVDKRVKALGDVVGDAYADDVEDTRPETSESEHDPSEVPEHANRRRAAGGHLVKALRAAQPASALERALSRQAWLSALAVAEEFAMTVVAARFRSAVIDALGAAGTPGAQEILLRFILEAPGRTSEERHRAMLTLQQVRHPTNATILEVARRADCDTAAVDVAEAEECRLAIRVLGALVHKYDTSECAFAGRCAPNFTERIMSNVAHNLRRRRARFDEQGWPGRGGGRRLSMREASDSDEADLLSMIVSLGNAASSEHVDTILEIASFAGESNVRDAAIDALRKMDDPQVAPALWGFVHHSKDRPAQLRALRVLLDRDSDHHSGHLRLPSTRRAEDGAHRRRLQDEHAFNDIVGAYLDHASFGDQAEEVAKQIDRHLKVHSGRIKMDEPKHSRAHAKLKHRTTRRGEGRKPRGMKWTELPPAGAIAPAARAIDAAVVDPRRRQLGFVKDLSFSWSNGLNGELGFYEHKTIFELGNEEFGAEAYVTTDDIAYISLPLFGSLKFGVRVNNEAVIRLWANVAMISVDWKIFHAEYSYIKEQEISFGDFPLLPGGCPLDKKGSSRRRRLVGGRRVVGSNPSLPGAIVGDAEDAEAPAGRRRLEDDATDTASNEVFDQGSLNNIPDITAWKNVLSFRPNKAIQTALDEDKQYLQRIENGLEMVAVDYQAIKINTLPTGTSAHDLLDKLRRGEDQSGAFPALNAEAGTFHKPSLGYGRTWGEGDPTDATGNPTGFLGSRVTMKHELQCGKRRGDCDDGSLIVTEVKNDPDDYHFMLTTNNEDGDYNSATGNREIGIKKVGPDTFLYTRGAHRVTTQAIADVDYEEETEESSSGGGGRRLAGKPRMRAKWRKLMDGVTPPSEDSAGGGDPTGQQDVDNDGAREMAVKEEEEEEEGPRGWVQGEPHLGGRFLRHMEIAPGNWSHYSNESHPATGGRRTALRGAAPRSPCTRWRCPGAAVRCQAPRPRARLAQSGEHAAAAAQRRAPPALRAPRRGRSATRAAR